MDAARFCLSLAPSMAAGLPRRSAATFCPSPSWPLQGRKAPVGLNTVRFIRSFVFRMSQTEFAVLLGTSQGRVSCWESEGRFPSFIVADLVRAHGRAVCAESGQSWSDSWFFEVPT